MLPINHRATRLLGTAVLGAGLVLAPLTAQPAQAMSSDVTINLLNFNDFHGRIAAASSSDPIDTVKFAGTIEKERATYGDANTLLLSAGDNIGASLFASATQNDQPTIDVLNALDVKASAVGNHEFDKGFADLTDRVINSTTPNAKFAYLGANVYKTGTTTAALPEYAIFDVAGVKVGVIGAVTQETPSLVSPDGIKGLTFGDPVDAVNRVADQLTDGNAGNGEAQVLVAEYHEGAVSSTPATLADQLAAGGAFEKIVDKTSPKVAALFTAHTHQYYNYDADIIGGTGKRPVIQTGSYSDRIGQVVLTVSAATGAVKSYTSKLIARTTDSAASLISAYPRAKAVDDITKAALDNAKAVGSQPVADQTADITTAFKDGAYTNGVYTGGTRDDRSKESTMGNLVADSLLKTLSDPNRGGAQIGLVNPGGLRAELYYKANGSTAGDGEGKIVRSEANSVLPFVNNLWTTTLTGKQLKSVLEEQWQPAGSSRPYLQLGLSKNVSYTYNPAAAAGSHITRIWVNGNVVADTDTFRIGSFSFLLAGGDNFTTFKSGTNTKDSGLVDYEAWIDYLKSNSPVSPSYIKHAVAMSSPSSTTVGNVYNLAISNLDLTSLGSPANTTISVSVGGSVVANNVSVTNGSAQATFVTPHAGEVVITANPSGTVLKNAIVVNKADVIPLSPTSKKTVKKGSKVVFTVRLDQINNGIWPTGTLKTYAKGKLVDTQTLLASEKGKQKITLTKKDLKRFGKKTITIETKILSSDTVNDAVVRTIKLKIK